MRNEQKPIRVTPTNAGPDSKGVVSVFGWELEGLTAFYLVGGAVGSFVLAFALSNWPFSSRVMISLLPVSAAAVWIKIFVHGKPPCYQRDVLERWVSGAGFRLRPQLWRRWRHPRGLVMRLQQQGDSRNG